MEDNALRFHRWRGLSFASSPRNNPFFSCVAFSIVVFFFLQRIEAEAVNFPFVEIELDDVI